jgi:hypothetical protein
MHEPFKSSMLEYLTGLEILKADFFTADLLISILRETNVYDERLELIVRRGNTLIYREPAQTEAFFDYLFTAPPEPSHERLLFALLRNEHTIKYVRSDLPRFHLGAMQHLQPMVATELLNFANSENLDVFADFDRVRNVESDRKRAMPLLFKPQSPHLEAMARLAVATRSQSLLVFQSYAQALILQNHRRFFVDWFAFLLASDPMQFFRRGEVTRQEACTWRLKELTRVRTLWKQTDQGYFLQERNRSLLYAAPKFVVSVEPDENFHFSDEDSEMLANALIKGWVHLPRAYLDDAMAKHDGVFVTSVLIPHFYEKGKTSRSDIAALLDRVYKNERNVIGYVEPELMVALIEKYGYEPTRRDLFEALFARRNDLRKHIRDWLWGINVTANEVVVMNLARKMPLEHYSWYLLEKEQLQGQARDDAEIAARLHEEAYGGEKESRYWDDFELEEEEEEEEKQPQPVAAESASFDIDELFTQDVESLF